MERTTNGEERGRKLLLSAPEVAQTRKRIEQGEHPAPFTPSRDLSWRTMARAVRGWFPGCDAAAILAAGTLAASGRGTIPYAPEEKGVQGLRRHAGCAHVADAVLEAALGITPGFAEDHGGKG